MKKSKLIEEVWDERKEAIRRTDEKIFAEFKDRIKRGKPVQDRRVKILSILFAFSVICMILGLLAFSLFGMAGEFNKRIEYRTTERIIREQPIINQEVIVNNITQYMKPENTANCIKVQAVGSNKYTMQCEEVKNEGTQ